MVVKEPNTQTIRLRRQCGELLSSSASAILGTVICRPETGGPETGGPGTGGVVAASDRGIASLSPFMAGYPSRPVGSGRYMPRRIASRPGAPHLGA